MLAVIISQGDFVDYNSGKRDQNEKTQGNTPSQLRIYIQLVKLPCIFVPNSKKAATPARRGSNGYHGIRPSTPQAHPKPSPLLDLQDSRQAIQPLERSELNRNVIETAL